MTSVIFAQIALKEQASIEYVRRLFAAVRI
jgi:hypothetical protein